MTLDRTTKSTWLIDVGNPNSLSFHWTLTEKPQLLSTMFYAHLTYQKQCGVCMEQYNLSKLLSGHPVYEHIACFMKNHWCISPEHGAQKPKQSVWTCMPPRWLLLQTDTHLLAVCLLKMDHRLIVKFHQLNKSCHLQFSCKICVMQKNSVQIFIRQKFLVNNAVYRQC